MLKIATRKQKIGPFQSIEEVLELDGFGIKVMERFCDSILQCQAAEMTPDKNKPLAESTPVIAPRKKVPFVQPLLQDHSRKSIKTCVSLQIDLNCIAWTKFRIDSEVLEVPNRITVEEWNFHEFLNNDKKLSLSDLIQILIYLSSRIPVADVYVVEAQQTAQPAKQPGNPVQMNINVQKAQLLSMISILMACRNETFASQSDGDGEDGKNATNEIKNQQQTLFFLKNFLASRLYRTTVGAERVSSEYVIENVLNSCNQPLTGIYNFIEVMPDCRDNYEKSLKKDREYLGQSMLIGLTFLKLCVVKCSESLLQLNKVYR